MTRQTYVLGFRGDRERAKRAIEQAPVNSRVEIKEAKRTVDQNARLWALLTAVAEQASWAGKRRTTTEWKDLFTAAVKIAGGGVEAVPGLEGGLMILGLHTSEMSKAEMVELQDYIEAWAAGNGVVIPERADAVAA